MSDKTPSNSSQSRRKSSSRKSLGLASSASKMIRLMIEKEKKRKLNHYRSAKLKRAEVLESRRGIADALAQPVDFEDRDPNITDDNSLVSLDVDSFEENEHMTATPVTNKTASNVRGDFEEAETTIRAEETPAVVETVVVESNKASEMKKPTSELHTSKQQHGIGSRIGSTIASRFNSIKNSIKKMVTNSSRPNVAGGGDDTYTISHAQTKSSVVRSLHEISNFRANKCVPTQSANVCPSLKPREVR